MPVTLYDSFPPTQFNGTVVYNPLTGIMNVAAGNYFVSFGVGSTNVSTDFALFVEGVQYPGTLNNVSGV